MKTLLGLLGLLLFGIHAAIAQQLPDYCLDDSDYRQQLQSLGPLVAVGASVSGALWARPFPNYVADQMCLGEGNGFDAYYSFLFFGARLSFLEKMYIERRPRIVIALDHLHHSTKGKRFNATTRAYIDREFARIALDCSHEIVDCSEDGKFRFVREENYRPVVLLGDIYSAYYTVDCSTPDLHENNSREDRLRNSVENKQRGCIDDYAKINRYMWQKAEEIPNLHLMPVDRFFRHLHRGLPYIYDLDDRVASFYSEDLFWDDFHPWSEPGSQVMANIVLDRINRLIDQGEIPSATRIPLVSIDDRFYRPFTGIVLIDDSRSGIPDPDKPRFITERGESFVFEFADESRAYRSENGDWGHSESFRRGDAAYRERIGDNPLVITVDRLSDRGEFILTDRQMTLLRKVSTNPDHRLLGGILSAAHRPE